MSLTRYLEDPWKNSHPAFSESVFNIQPAPEYASSEVVVASLYRAVGYAGHSEASVAATGRDFDRSTRQSASSERVGSTVSSDTWLTVLHSALESPKLPNQSARRFLQLSPVVPDVSLYSGSARPSGNSWNPGLLVKRMLRLGSMSDGAADQLWGRLFSALSVTEHDDVWARWLQVEFEKRRPERFNWSQAPLGDAIDIPFAEKSLIEFPARQFVRDIDAILAAKSQMTRRQWISLLEAVLRLGCVSHVLWLCDVNAGIWALAQAAMNGTLPPHEDDLASSVLSLRNPYLVHGNPSLKIIRDYASAYLVARLGINLLWWHLDPAGALRPVRSSSDLAGFLRKVYESRATLLPATSAEIVTLNEQHARALACKKGIGSNLLEFGRHVLGQRQTANESLRGYDQGYFLRKKGQHSSAPWVVALGPVALLALVHCCLKEVAGPRSVDRLCRHLLRYGLAVDADDVAEGDLGQTLRMLGLVLDSPDAESGMLLVPPFQDAS